MAQVGTVPLRLRRDTLIAARTAQKYEARFGDHVVDCQIDRGGGSTHAVQAHVSPTVTFEQGKAVDAAIRWGDVEAPLLAQGVIWPATALDNQVNMLGNQLVGAFNDLLIRACAEVSAQLKSK